jgi:prepilin-type N-terminal cleavage/methylation domain-containing protein
VVSDEQRGIPPAHRVRAVSARLLSRSTALLSRRRGVTLLELLVVLLILLMVTAAAIPIVAPAMQNRQMREASRLVSSYLSTARSRAVETGRPVGVKLERFGGIQPFAMVLSQIEVPPPYAGDTYDSKCMVAGVMAPGDPAALTRVPAGMDARWFTATVDGTFNSALVRVGDQIRFGGKGPLYTILGPDVLPMPMPDGVIDLGAPLDVAYLYPTGSLPTAYFPWEAVPAPPETSYQVIRQPVRSATAPLQLPEGIVVDLVSSGVGSSESFNAVTYETAPMMPMMTGTTPPMPVVVFDPVVVFSPAGRLESVSSVAEAGRLVHPTDAVYLLLGRRELMYDVTSKGQPADIVDQNLGPIPPATAVFANVATWPAPPAHFWVSVGYQTGLVTVAEVAPNLQDYAPSMPKELKQEVIADALGAARVFARQSQSVGGR